MLVLGVLKDLKTTWQIAERSMADFPFLDSGGEEKAPPPESSALRPVTWSEILMVVGVAGNGLRPGSSIQV